MRREHLTWFAAGAATSSVAAAAAFLLLKSTEEDRWFLRVAEDGQSMSDGVEVARWKGAEIARDCGAKSFEAFPGRGSDQSDVTRIPLVTENNPALGCIVERARDANLWIGVQLEDFN